MYRVAPWHMDMMFPGQVMREFKVELKACPFCACPTVGVYLAAKNVYVECIQCDSRGPIIRSDDDRELKIANAIRLWNRRGQWSSAG